MIAEEKRILKMFYLLTRTDGYIKANELARLLSVSERTVKGEMEPLKAFIQKCGCTLESVRGRGYCLKIRDQACFQQSRERVEILFSNIDKGHKENQVYRIARAIMRFEGTDGEGYFRLENLADRLFISASAMKKEMPGVRDFLGSFNLTLQSRPGLGLRLAGDEFSQRLCILELYENHFRKRVVAFRDNEYEQAFADRGDKDQIRRATLEEIRVSDNEVFDIYVNRLVDYLLLMRNRVQDGRRLGGDGHGMAHGGHSMAHGGHGLAHGGHDLAHGGHGLAHGGHDLAHDGHGLAHGGHDLAHRGPMPGFPEELRSYREFTLAKRLTAALEAFPEFEADDCEAAGIALLLLLWGDWEEVPGLDERFPAFYPEAKRLSVVLTGELGARWNLDFTRIDPGFPETMVPGLLRVLIQMHFGYSRCRLVGNSISENAIKDSPLSMALADNLAEILCKHCGHEINEYSIQLLAVRLYGLIDSISYTYTPRRILVCARNGKDSARIIADSIRRRLGEEWIGKLTISELYEARKYPPESYDCLIGSFRPYAYRYAWPYIEVHQILQPQDYERVRRELVLSGFNLREAVQLCAWDVVQVHRDFAGNTIDSLLLLISYQWGKDLAAKEALAARFSDSRRLRMHNSVLTVFVPAAFTGKQIFELYMLKKPITFRKDNAKAILFAAVEFYREPVVLRFLEHAVRFLTDCFEQRGSGLDSGNIMDVLTELIRDSL